MIIYRAMCEEEFEATLHRKQPDFRTRFKWFTPNLEWLYSRVKGGKFNNSDSCKGRYVRVCAFEWKGIDKSIINNNEIQFDRRKNPTIKFLQELLEKHNLQVRIEKLDSPDEYDVYP